MGKLRGNNGKPKAGTPSERFEDLSPRRWWSSRECSAECKSEYWKAKNSEPVRSRMPDLLGNMTIQQETQNQAFINNWLVSPGVTTGHRHHFQAFERNKSILSEASKPER